MKKIVVMCVLGLTLCLANDLQAEDCCKPRKVTVYRCVSPCDVFKGSICYVGDVGCRVAHGVGEVVKAPFRAKFCLPQARTYIYRHPRVIYIPGQWDRLDSRSHIRAYQ